MGQGQGLGQGQGQRQQQQVNQLPEIFASGGEVDLDLDMGEMSMFFGNWLGSNQPVLDLLNMDFANDTI